MAKPSIVPAAYVNDPKPYLHAKGDRNGSVTQVSGTVTVPNTTAVAALVGLVPFQKGARFVLNDKSVHITDIDNGTDSLLGLGVAYDTANDGTDDLDAFATGSTSGRAGGFIALTNPDGLVTRTTGNGWLVLVNEANITEAEGTATFSIGVVYD